MTSLDLHSRRRRVNQQTCRVTGTEALPTGLASTSRPLSVPLSPQACPSSSMPSPNTPAHPSASPTVSAWLESVLANKIYGMQGIGHYRAIEASGKKEMCAWIQTCLCVSAGRLWNLREGSCLHMGNTLQKILLFCAFPRWNIFLWRVEVLQIISRWHGNRFKYYLSPENKLMQCPSLGFRTQQEFLPESLKVSVCHSYSASCAPQGT